MHAAELPVMPYGQFGLLAVQFSLARPPGTNLTSRSSVATTSVRVPFSHGGECQHYRMAEPTCSPPSSSTGIRPSWQSGQAAETRRADSQAKAPSPYTAQLRIPVAKASIAALAYDPAPYRNRPDCSRSRSLRNAVYQPNCCWSARY